MQGQPLMFGGMFTGRPDLRMAIGWPRLKFSWKRLFFGCLAANTFLFNSPAEVVRSRVGGGCGSRRWTAGSGGFGFEADAVNPARRKSGSPLRKSALRLRFARPLPFRRARGRPAAAFLRKDLWVLHQQLLAHPIVEGPVPH